MATEILTSVAKVKTHLGIDDVSEDTLLAQLITEVDRLVALEIKREALGSAHPLSSTAGTEHYDGTGREQLLLRRRPVTSIGRVAVDADGYYGKATDAFPVADDWVEGTDFAGTREDESEHNPGILISLKFRGFGGLRKGVWPEGRGNILVTYTAGYITIPAELEHIANQLVAAAWNASDIAMGGPVEMMRLGDETWKLLKDGGGLDILRVQRVLGKYKG